jgi:hypothetical protein
VSVTGQYTHFTNSSVIDLGTGVTITNVAASDATHLNAQLAIAAGTAVGARDLKVTTGSEIVSLTKVPLRSLGRGLVA